MCKYLDTCLNIYQKKPDCMRLSHSKEFKTISFINTSQNCIFRCDIILFLSPTKTYISKLFEISQKPSTFYEYEVCKSSLELIF